VLIKSAVLTGSELYIQFFVCASVSQLKNRVNQLSLHTMRILLFSCTL
jgi:hypothetical protein